ncbi:MAG: hypothetical protein WCI22_07195 [Actinomycetota bacterium]
MKPPAVALADDDAASGMAAMLADLLTSNVHDFRSRRVVARAARGVVVFTAADRQLSVTLLFAKRTIEVRDGVTPGAATVAAPWLVMAKVCSGTMSPWRAWRDGDLKISGKRVSPVAAAASWALSVPSSFYDEADRRDKKGSAR